MNPPILTDLSHEIKGVYSFKLDKFTDERGENGELTNDIAWCKTNGFKLISYSKSKKSVIRGMHSDQHNFKLLQCLQGKIQLFLVDIRPNSPTFNNTKEFILDENDNFQILVPPSVLNGHLCLSETCIFYYQWSFGYVPIEEQLHGHYKDPKFNLQWLEDNPIMSNRDK